MGAATGVGAGTAVGAGNIVMSGMKSRRAGGKNGGGEELHVNVRLLEGDWKIEEKLKRCNP